MRLYIYFLKNNERVVYVGKTKNIKRRIKEHKDKAFDSYDYIKCDESNANYLEDKYIMKYDPKYNRCLNSKGEYVNLKTFCDQNNLDIGKARRIYQRTPYINPIFNENFIPYELNSLKAIYEGDNNE